MIPEKDERITAMRLCNNERRCQQLCPHGVAACLLRHSHIRAAREAADPSPPVQRPTPVGWGHTNMELVAKHMGKTSVVHLLKSVPWQKIETPDLVEERLIPQGMMVEGLTPLQRAWLQIVGLWPVAHGGHRKHL